MKDTVLNFADDTPLDWYPVSRELRRCLRLRGKPGLEARNASETPLCQGKNEGGAKRTCKSVEQEQNQKNGLRLSWA